MSFASAEILSFSPCQRVVSSLAAQLIAAQGVPGLTGLGPRRDGGDRPPRGMRRFRLQVSAAPPAIPADRPEPRITAALRDIAAEQRAMTIRMLLEGRADPAGAKRLGVSPRTYASYVSDLKNEFEVETRFQLGYEMGKRGKSGNPEDWPGAEERLPVSAEQVASERR